MFMFFFLSRHRHRRRHRRRRRRHRHRHRHHHHRRRRRRRHHHHHHHGGSRKEVEGKEDLNARLKQCSSEAALAHSSTGHSYQVNARHTTNCGDGERFVVCAFGTVPHACRLSVFEVCVSCWRALEYCTGYSSLLLVVCVRCTVILLFFIFWGGKKKKKKKKKK